MFAFHPKDPHMHLLPYHKPVQAYQPGGNFIHSMAEATLDDFLPQLPEGAGHGHVMPLAKHSITPCSKLVDAGCQIELDQSGAKVIYKGQVILKGDRKNNMWYLNLPDRIAFTSGLVHGTHQTTTQVNCLQAGGAIQSVYQLGRVLEAVLFFHAALGSPSRTLLRAAILGKSNLLNGRPVFGPNP